VDHVLTSFIRALRNADVRVSTAETLDAFNAVQLVGYADRQLLKQSLALVLPKTQDEKASFDTTFDQFFSFKDSEALQPPDEASAAEPSMDSAAAQGSGGEGGKAGEAHGTPGSEAGRARQREPNAADPKVTASTASPGAPGAASALGQLLMRGNPLEIGAAINTAGERVHVHEIELFTQKGVYTRRILQAMGQEELQAEIQELAANPGPGERRLGLELTRRRDWLRERVRDFVEQQFLLHADVTGRRLREDLLRDVRLSAVDPRHYRQLEEIVRRMARRLVAAYSSRRRVSRRGQLHVPRTLRRNLKYDDAIFDLHWKSIKSDRPKVFAICDVSGSVANHAAFMLMFLYSLEEVLPKVRSFAFSSELGEVSELFARHGLEDAIALTLRSYGNGSTDYGQALADFRRLCLDDVDRRSTVIILGDARNNYGDARTDLLKELYDRSRRVLWLNPEARSMWNTGDSEMRYFGVYCHQVEECSTLAQLERFVSRLLQHQ
jgi:uncharacterized protein